MEIRTDAPLITDEDLVAGRLGFGGPSPADLIDGPLQQDGSKHEMIDKAKHLGRTTAEIGTKVLHMVEDKVHIAQENNSEIPRKARYIAAGAGILAVAGGISMAANSRHHQQQQPRPKSLIIRTKEIFPNR
jgi:hypothetical protein